MSPREQSAPARNPGVQDAPRASASSTYGFASRKWLRPCDAVAPYQYQNRASEKRSAREAPEASRSAHIAAARRLSSSATSRAMIPGSSSPPKRFGAAASAIERK